MKYTENQKQQLQKHGLNEFKRSVKPKEKYIVLESKINKK